MMPFVDNGYNVVPARNEYQTILRSMGIGVLDEDGDPVEQNPNQKKLQQELFGEQVVVADPDSYYHMEFMVADTILPSQFETMTLEDRARWRAGKTIKHMVETIRRHRELQERERKKAAQEARSAMEKAQPKRGLFRRR
jgi:hypothetical protein